MAELKLILDPPQPSVIKQVESLLEHAKSGELQELVYVCGWRGNSVNHGHSRIQNRMRIIGELEQVKWHLMSYDK